MNAEVELKIEENVSLAGHTSWKVGGKAEFYAAPKTQQELRAAVSWAVKEKKPLQFLGRGTNALISDEGVSGLLIHVRKLSDIEFSESGGRVQITADCGAAKAQLLKFFLQKKLAPALFLAGLPGDIGGGVVMNAGVSEDLTPREFVEITDWVEVLSLEEEPVLKRYEKNELSWGYRRCEGWQPGVICRVGLSWPLEPHPEILQKVKDANQRRLLKQPLDMPSCGSVFKNPPGDAAGRLIDSCGLRGFHIGGARVSEKHANFIVNTGGATATEIDRVIQHVQKVVQEKAGVALTNEVAYLGAWPKNEFSRTP